MRLTTNSDPKQSGSSEWICISERIRERLAEESLVGRKYIFPTKPRQVGAGGWFPRSITTIEKRPFTLKTLL
ncbi:MAG TPA: hypothetical protein VE843_08300 [Ktedonobacteraceae bacterium]|nr:hypothetical protein [Ktedonobacteraceae bacterium]